MSTDHATLVSDALRGNRRALEELVLTVQDRVYALSLRVLGHPQDAEDATQEILVIAITNLASFRGEAAFTTWLYTIASRHLLRFDATRARQHRLDELASDLGQPTPATPVDALLAEEVFVGCTLAVMSALNREQRLAFVLGEVMEFDHHSGAQLLGISAAAFRKRVSRARAKLQAFYGGRCGVFDPEGSCRCENQAPLNIARGNLDPDSPRLCGPRADMHKRATARRHVRDVAHLKRLAAMYRAQPQWPLPAEFVTRLHALVDTQHLSSEKS